MTTIKNLVSDVMAAPIGEIIAAVGQGVAEAQEALDQASLARILAIYSEEGDAGMRLLQEIGYQPTFYALPETTGEIQVALSLSGETRNPPSAPQAPATPGKKVKNPPLTISTLGRSRLLHSKLPASRVYAAPVNADLTNRYGFQATAAAKVSFKIVPVPPPGRASEIRVVPTLTGVKWAAAIALADLLDQELIPVDAQENPVEEPDAETGITEQLPKPGTIVTAGGSIRVTLA